MNNLKKLREEIRFLEKALQEIKWTRDSIRDYANTEGDYTHLLKSELKTYNLEIRALNFKEDAHRERIDTLGVKLIQAEANPAEYEKEF